MKTDIYVLLGRGSYLPCIFRTREALGWFVACSRPSICARRHTDGLCVLVRAHSRRLGQHIIRSGEGPSAMLMEHAPGRDLFDELTYAKGNRLSATVSRLYAAQVASGLRYLHEECVAPQCIVHRDVKPENIIVVSSGMLRLTDFGFAKALTSQQGRTFTFVGTPEYMAPEILAGRHLTPDARAQTGYRCGYGKGVDWWALGTLIFEMLIGCAPSPNRIIS